MAGYEHNMSGTEKGARVRDAVVVPSHGQGRLAPFKPGEIANPGGRPKTLKEVRKLARKESLDALHALIGCYKRPDGKLDRTADGRVVTAAATTVLTWAFGKPPDDDAFPEREETTIDLSGLTVAQRRQLLDTLGKITTTTAVEPADDGPSFDPERFAPEPMTIEGDVATVEASSAGVEPAVPQARVARVRSQSVASLSQRKPKPKAVAQKAVAGPKRPPGRPKKAVAAPGAAVESEASTRAVAAVEATADQPSLPKRARLNLF